MTQRSVRTIASVLLGLALGSGSALAQSLPAGWASQDIGSVGVPGAASGAADGTFTVDGAGADVWGAADALRFVYTTLDGDGSIVTQVVTEEAVDAWTKAGVMMRESLDPSSRQAFMLVSPGKGLAFQRRPSTAGATLHTAGGAGTAPYFVKLTRAGSVVTAYRSLDGATWTVVGSESIAMTASIYVGVAVSSHNPSSAATATFAATAVTGLSEVSAQGGLPTGWSSQDIGVVGAAGAAAMSAGSFSVTGAGADVWGSADAFRFAYTTLTGDAQVVVQTTSVENVNAWTKAGIMMRETLGAGSRHAYVVVSAGKGVAFQRRATTGGASESTSATTGVAPSFVRLTRVGSLFTAAKSVDGVNWTTVGTATIPMAATIQVGLAVTSHVAGSLATATFTTPVIAPVAAPPPPPAPTVKVPGELHVLQWNSHHGGTTSTNIYDPERFVTAALSYGPDVVSFNEVESQAQVDRLVGALEAQTGQEWNYSWDGRGNLAASPLAMLGNSTCLVNASAGRKAAHLSLMAEGHIVNVWSAHLALDSSAVRSSEVSALVACGASWAESKVVAGDFNANPGTAELNLMGQTHQDAWSQAKTLGAALNYPGNCDGCTKNSRIDFIFASKTAAGIELKSTQVFDSRDVNGVMASDHKPTLAIYALK